MLVTITSRHHGQPCEAVISGVRKHGVCLALHSTRDTAESKGRGAWLHRAQTHSGSDRRGQALRDGAQSVTETQKGDSLILEKNPPGRGDNEGQGWT